MSEQRIFAILGRLKYDKKIALFFLYLSLIHNELALGMLSFDAVCLTSKIFDM